MPGESGIDLVRFVHNTFPATAVVMISVVDDPLTVEGLIELGVYGYVLKPFDPNQVVICVQNALKRSALEEALRSRERILLDTVPFPIFYKDREGGVLGYNQAFASILHDAGNQPIARFFTELTTQPAAANRTETDGRFYRERGTETFEVSVPLDHRITRNFLVNESPYFNENGALSGTISVMVDITDRKRAENELRREQKMEAIGRLTAGIAHEINNPIQYVGDNIRFLQDAFRDLNTIIVRMEENLEDCDRKNGASVLFQEFAELRQKYDLDYLREEIPRAVDQTLDGVNQVVKIIRAMKEFSHLRDEEKTAVNINARIESAVTVSRNEWKYVADLDTDLAPSLPAIEGYPNELNQVFLNLIINAAHAVREARPDNHAEKGLIRIRTFRDRNAVEIRISDNGCGIPREIRDRVYEPFFTTKKVGKGTGQGLAIAHRIVVERHQGSLEFESEVGKGTVFKIRLPRVMP